MSKRNRKKLNELDIREEYDKLGETYNLSKIIDEKCPKCYNSTLEVIDLGKGLMYFCNGCKYRSFERYDN